MEMSHYMQTVVSAFLHKYHEYKEMENRNDESYIFQNIYRENGKLGLSGCFKFHTNILTSKMRFIVFPFSS